MIHNPVRKQLPALSNPGAAGDLRSGKQLVGADGSVVTGALAEVQQAVPTISVSSGGLITASAAQDGGIVAAGSQNATQQLSTQGAATITPGTAAQTAAAAGRYTTGDIKVAGEPNLVPANIAKGVTIFGVTGSYSGAEPVYEIVPPENISFETAGSPIRITINLSRNVYAVYGLSLWVGITEANATATFSYPSCGYGEPDESKVYRTTGTQLSLYTLSGSGNSLYLTKPSDSSLSGKTLDTQFGAAVYYAPM